MEESWPWAWLYKFIVYPVIPFLSKTELQHAIDSQERQANGLLEEHAQEFLALARLLGYTDVRTVIAKDWVCPKCGTDYPLAVHPDGICTICWVEERRPSSAKTAK